MKQKSYKGKKGTSSKLINRYVVSTLNRENKAKKRRSTPKTNVQRTKKAREYESSQKPILLRKPMNIGRLQALDFRDLAIGFSAVRQLIDKGIDVFSTDFLSKKSGDVGKFQEGIILYKDNIDSSLRRADHYLQDRLHLKEYVEDMRSSYRVAQAARDGILIKQETRKEKDNSGEEKTVTYDVSITEREVIETINDYRNLLERYKYNQLSNYVDIGVNVAGILGMIVQSLNDRKNNEIKDDKESFGVVSLGILAVSTIRLLTKSLPEKMWDKAKQKSTENRRKSYEFLSNEQISHVVEEDTLESLKVYIGEEIEYRNKGNNIDLLLEQSISFITAIVTGMYVSKQVKAKGKTSLDVKTFSESLISLGTTKGYVGAILRTISHFRETNDLENEVRNLTIKVAEIEKQMREKVYPLKGATEPFDSFSIENLDGKFYPTTDYETGEVSFSREIKVPEFSVKRGETVLLTGDSGAGKSTFLRLLKRGDINNQNCIKLDNGEIVDNLGREYISFRPSTELGNESTVLSQITGKESVSQLSPEKRENMIKILKELDLYSDRIFDDLASKRFSQFSTGQQRRLALSKMLYRIKDGTSVIIVDEPVGNVEDSLIKEQLELIKKYAVDNNLMLILVTHRIDLAEEIADKRYHISKEGVMQEVKIKEQETPKEIE